MKRIWLVSRPVCGRTCWEPLRGFSSKAAAKVWVREQDSSLVFTHYTEPVGFTARTRGLDSEVVYSVERVPFGAEVQP